MSPNDPNAPLSQNSLAESLKSQADTLYKNKQYNAAYKKYSQAIKVDPYNAVLYSNRAAASIGLKDNLEARRDAQKATQLDPNFSRAWCRLGTALNELGYWVTAVDVWETALKTLPPVEQSLEKEKELRSICEAGLKKANHGLDTPVEPYTLDPNDLMHNLPWHRAERMRYELIQKQEESSAFVILRANKLFNEGVNLMNQQIRITLSEETQIKAKQGAIARMCDAILRDPRTFNVPHPKFFDQLPWQRKWEFLHLDAGDLEQAGPKIIKEESLRRLKKSGWNTIRPVLELTVKNWILNSFILNTIQENVSQETIKNSIDIIEWGRSQWPDVPCKQRGEIFELYFLRGVKSLYLYLILEVQLKKKKEQQKWKDWDEITKLAQEIIDDYAAHPSDIIFYPDTNGDLFEEKWSRHCAFWIYPKTDAHAALAKYYEARANDTRTDVSTRRSYWEKVGRNMLDASYLMTGDDERYPQYLRRLLVANWHLGAPLRVTFPICEEIGNCLPGVKKIWEKSYFFTHCLPGFEEALDFLKENKELMEKEPEGKLTRKVCLEDTICPPDMIPLDYPSEWIPISK